MNWRFLLTGVKFLKVPLHCFTWYLYLLDISILISLFYWTYCEFNLNISNNFSESFIENLFKEENNRDTEFSLGSISNFKRKVQSYFKRNEHDVEYWDWIFSQPSIIKCLLTHLIPLVLTVIKFPLPSQLLAVI